MDQDRSGHRSLGIPLQYFSSLSILFSALSSNIEPRKSLYGLIPWLECYTLGYRHKLNPNEVLIEKCRGRKKMTEQQLLLFLDVKPLGKIY